MSELSIYEKRNIQKNYDKQLKKLHQKNINKLRNKENELKNLQSSQDLKIKDINENGQIRINGAQNQQQVKLQNEVKHYKEELGKYDESLKNHKSLIDKEIKNLKHQSAERKQQITYDSDTQVHDFLDKNRASFSKLELENSLKIKQQNQTNQIKLDQSQRKNLDHLQKVAVDSDGRLDKELNRTRTQQKFQAQKIRKQVRQQKLRDHTELDSLKNENSRLKIIENDRHNREIKQIDDKFSYDMQKKKKINDAKYLALTKDYNNLVARLKASTDKEIKTIVEDHASFKNHLSKKVADRFYHVNLIDPKITDMGDHYIISIKVPAHEKENVSVSVNQRQIRISMTRRFAGELETENNTRNIAKRSEVLTKLFHTPEILNKSKVSQFFNQGVLSFKITKA